jgi:hypothetical protein
MACGHIESRRSEMILNVHKAFAKMSEDNSPSDDTIYVFGFWNFWRGDLSIKTPFKGRQRGSNACKPARLVAGHDTIHHHSGGPLYP